MEVQMNVMNPDASELMLSSLKNVATQSRPIVPDNGEVLVIEGRYVTVDANNRDHTPAPVSIVPSWLVGQYA